jgi:cell division inhibitor SepF
VRLPAPSSLPEQRERPTGPAALARITTLHPTSYNEARTIGERYRDGIPVIMNLTELDDASAKRLVDFAAGLVFALRGGFDKVTNRVFLLTPADVEVSADDARKLVSRVGSVGVERPRY